jgi:hypothetical protein
MKTYKRTFYWLNTKKFCGGVAVDQDRKVFKWIQLLAINGCLVNHLVKC